MDLSKVKPVPLPKTLLLVNNFVLNTTRFLNHFSTACEDKLLGVSVVVTECNTEGYMVRRPVGLMVCDFGLKSDLLTRSRRRSHNWR